MRLALGVLLATLSAASIGEAQSPEPLTAIVGANVVDVVTGAVRADRTVLIRGDRIEAELPGTSRVPRGARILRARDRWVIPGLWDMHIHRALVPRRARPELSQDFQRAQARYFPSILLAYGVTGVRDMAGDLANLQAHDATVIDSAGYWIRAFNTGQKLGDAPVVAGAPFPIETVDDVAESIRLLTVRGASHVKLDDLEPALLLAALDICRRERVPCTSHLPSSVPLTRIAAEGMRSIEHLFWFAEQASSIPWDQLVQWRREAAQPTIAQRILYKLRLRRLPPDVDSVLVATYDSVAARAVFRELAARGTWVTPTLVLHDLMLRSGPRLTTARDTALLIEVPSPGLLRESRAPAERRFAAQRYALFEQIVRDLQRAGVGLLAGSDAPTQSVPGAAIHAELALLQRAGLSPLEALQTATIQPARYLGIADAAGSIAPGRAADLVILRRNPLEDVANVSAIETVIIRGRVLPAAEREQLLTDARLAAGTVRSLLFGEAVTAGSRGRGR